MVESALNVAGEANKAAVAVEYERIGESPVVRIEDIECGGVGGGGVPLVGPGATVVGCNSGVAAVWLGMCDGSWSSNGWPVANDRCLPFCCFDGDAIGKGAKSLKGAGRPVLSGRRRGRSVCIGMGKVYQTK